MFLEGKEINSFDNINATYTSSLYTLSLDSRGSPLDIVLGSVCSIFLLILATCCML
jgi:hypothetical protein